MDIYYSNEHIKNNYENADVTVIKNGTEIFKKLFKDDYKTVAPTIFENSTESNRYAFYNILDFFVTPGEVNYIDTELLYTIRDCQLSYTHKCCYRKVQDLGFKVPWDKLKQLDIPIFDKSAFANYIVVPLLYSDIRWKDLATLYNRVLCKTLTEDNYARSLQDAYTVMRRVCSTRCIFGTETAIEKLYIKYKQDPSILDIVTEVMSVYDSKSSRYQGHFTGMQGFPTIDHLVKNIVKCENSETRTKLVNNYINALRTGDATLINADVNSKLPAAWQVAMKTKSSILNEISWKDLNYLLRIMYPDKQYISKNGYFRMEPMLNAAFRRKIKDKSIEETLQVLNETFKEFTHDDLSMDVLKRHYYNAINDENYFISKADQRHCRKILKIED